MQNQLQQTSHDNITSKQTTMHTFEYKTISITDDEDPVPILNAEGQNGWEVIFIEYDYAHRIWMKRKLD